MGGDGAFMRVNLQAQNRVLLNLLGSWLNSPQKNYTFCYTICYRRNPAPTPMYDAPCPRLATQQIQQNTTRRKVGNTSRGNGVKVKSAVIPAIFPQIVIGRRDED